MLQFGLDVLEEIDKINEEIGADLQVRIGINTGGPIIAGVLGTEKPLFDIIGDAINVASRLQSTDIPGHIQISESTCK
jgi:class 3 adenylate cyclase